MRFRHPDTYPHSGDYDGALRLPVFLGGYQVSTREPSPEGDPEFVPPGGWLPKLPDPPEATVHCVAG
jgi:hypothetical protein